MYLITVEKNLNVALAVGEITVQVGEKDKRCRRVPHRGCSPMVFEFSCFQKTNIEKSQGMHYRLSLCRKESMPASPWASAQGRISGMRACLYLKFKIQHLHFRSVFVWAWDTGGELSESGKQDSWGIEAQAGWCRPSTIQRSDREFVLGLDQTLGVGIPRPGPSP